MTPTTVPTTVATAPGKIILLGEHAVVHGRPAIAVPVSDVQAQAQVTNRPIGAGCHLLAPQIGLNSALAGAADSEPLALVVRLALRAVGLSNPDWQIQVTSTIPVAGGLGSGAAVSAALVRAIFGHAGATVSAATVSELVYAGEELHHGTPSGIDNTVIAYEQPVWFIRGMEPESFRAGAPLLLTIADSGIAAPTRETVGDVRRGLEADPDRYNAWFDEIGDLASQARGAIEVGERRKLGQLFDRNQALLAQLGVSSPPLERLVTAAREAGALGAKLSGGGRGGNVIALIDATTVDETPVNVVKSALLSAGARSVIVTRVGDSRA